MFSSTGIVQLSPMVRDVSEGRPWCQLQSTESLKAKFGEVLKKELVRCTDYSNRGGVHIHCLQTWMAICSTGVLLQCKSMSPL